MHVVLGLCACSHMTRVCQVSADWERASLRPSSQPSSVFKPSPVMGTYSTDGGFINTNLVTADEESQEFDDLIFALKTGEDPTSRTQRHTVHSYTLVLLMLCSTVCLMQYHLLHIRVYSSFYKVILKTANRLKTLLNLLYVFDLSEYIRIFSDENPAIAS